MITTYLKSALLLASSLALVGFALRMLFLRRQSEKDWARSERAVQATVAGIAPKGPAPSAQQPDITLTDYVRLFDPVEQDLIAYSSIAVFGPIVGSVIVHNNGSVLIYGTCTGNVTVLSGGAATVYGTVVGSVHNQGGTLTNHGRILGSTHAATNDTH
jgi:hypothetical protein